MSLAARFGIVVVLVVGATLFVISLGGDPPKAEPTNGETPVENGNPVAEGPPAKPGVLDSHENCKECHEEIWNEWTGDRHAKAWVGELYTEMSDNHRKPDCWSCHAPRPVLETGLASPAEARANKRESGINCLTCHLNKDRTHVVGSGEHPRGQASVPPDCGPIGWDKFPSDTRQEATINFCGRCHNLHGTHTEFLGSKYAREGKTCLSCHMEEVVGVVANGGKPRRRRSHRMKGGHSPEMLKRAMRVDAEVKEGQVVARIVNQGAGHRIPTDARHRAIRLFIEFFDKNGQPVAARAAEYEAQMDLVRLFYRWEHKEPTTIDPDGTLGKNNWRESSIAVPERAAGGSARLRLYYMLLWDWPKHKATLVDEKKVDLP